MPVSPFFGLLCGLLVGCQVVPGEVGDDGLRGAATTELARTRQDAAQQIAALRAPMVRQLRIARSWVRHGRIPLRETDALRTLLLPTLMELPRCVSMMVSDMTGYELMFLRNASGAVRSPDGKTGPWLMRDFRRQEWGAESRWQALDADGVPLPHRWRRRERWPSSALQWGGASGAPDDGIYDPRLRSWHEGARTARASEQGVHWTDVDLFYTSRTPGITAGIAALDPDGRQVVIAYDLELRELTTITRGLGPTAGARSVAFLEDARVLALPAGTPSQDVDQAAFVEVDALQQPALAALVAVWRAAGSAALPATALTVDGVRYWGAVGQVALHPGRALWLATVVPEAELRPTAAWPLQAAVWVALGLSLLALLVLLLRRRRAPATAVDAGRVSVAIAPRASIPTRTPSSEGARVDHMRALGEMAAGVAHDFNNLLTAIRANVDLAKEEAAAAEPDRAELSTCLEAIDISAGTGARMTRQLLDFGRGGGGHPQLLDSAQELQTLSRLLPRLLPSGIELHVELGQALQGIRLQPGQLEQIVMNLVINARDAMPTGGSITLSAERVAQLPDGVPHPEDGAGPMLHLSVRDTGEGMSAETCARIFEPFFTTKGTTGTGLGLATLYGIVQRAGGVVSVDSTPGVGTCFEVYLPSESIEPSAASGDPQQELSSVDTSGVTVLVCDDEEVSRLLVREVLSDLGFKVVSAESPDAALAMVQRRRAELDLAVVERSFAEMTGPSLVAALRQHHPGLRAVYLDGGALSTASDGEASTVSEPGRSVVIAKPVHRAALVAAVQQLAEQHGRQGAASGSG